MRTANFFRWSILTTAIVASLSAYADNQESALTKDIKAQAAQTIDSQIEHIIVTSRVTAPSTTKGDFSLIKAPQNVQIFSDAFLAEQGAVLLQDSLKNVAGIQPGGYFNGYDYFRIRGFDASQNIYLDGLRLNDNGLGSNVEQSNLETLEVMKGPSSTLYGAGAISGMVNLVSKRPEASDSTTFNASVGNEDFQEFNVDINRILNEDGDIYGRLAMTYRDSATSVDYVDGTNRIFVAPSLTFEINDKSQLTLLTSYTKDDVESGMPLPAIGTVIDSDLGDIPLDRYIGNANNPGTIENETYRLGYEYRYQMSDSISFRQNLRYQDSTSDWVDLYYPSSYDATTGDLSLYKFSYDTHWKTWAIDTGINGSFDSGDIEHTYTLGLDIFTSELTTRSALGSNYPTINLYDPDYSVFPEVETNNWGPATTVENKIYGLYAQDQIAFNDQWTLTLGARADYYKQAATNDYETQLSPRAGISYAINDNWVTYASYSEAFTPQSYLDTNGNILDPEFGRQWEIGLKTNAMNGDLNATVSLYDLTKENVAIADVDALGNFTYSASGELQSKGVELDLQWLITDSWQLIGHAAYTHAVDAQYDKPVANVPKYSAGGWLKYNVDEGQLSGLSMALGVNYYSKQEGNSASVLSASTVDDFDLPAYTVADINVGYSWSNYELKFIVNNLFDKDYFSGSGDMLRVLPAEGRLARLDFTWYW